MAHIAVIGAGITGVTTAYALLERGHSVTVIDRHRYPAMETSYANGGQLSGSVLGVQVADPREDPYTVTPVSYSMSGVRSGNPPSASMNCSRRRTM